MPEVADVACERCRSSGRSPRKAQAATSAENTRSGCGGQSGQGRARQNRIVHDVGELEEVIRSETRVGQIGFLEKAEDQAEPVASRESGGRQELLG